MKSINSLVQIQQPLDLMYHYTIGRRSPPSKVDEPRIPNTADGYRYPVATDDDWHPNVTRLCDSATLPVPQID
jgi:hypothetical protein